MRKGLLCVVVVVAAADVFTSAPALAGSGSLYQTSIASPAPAMADATELHDQNKIETIVVTAQKRSENLQNVPIAVSAVSGAQLARTGTNDLVNIRSLVPGLNVTSTNGRLTMSVRGIGSTATGSGIENPVALYIDGVYMATASASLLSLNQIERIEVLKGPQGTLFGRNATGGLVNVITRDPSSHFKASGDVSYGNYNDLVGRLYVAGPIAANIKGDVAIYARRQGHGWGTNLATGDKIYNIDHDLAVRSKWIVTPWSGSTITLSGDYSDTRDTMLPLVARPGSINPFAPSVRQPDLGYDIATSHIDPHTVKSGGGSIRVVQELGDVQLMSLTAYRKSRAFLAGDIDSTPANIQSFKIVQHASQFSEEVQLSSVGHARFEWIVGGFHFHASGDTPAVIPLLNFGIIRELGDGRLITRSDAAFGQATYQILPHLRATLGGRLTHEVKAAMGVTQRIYPLAANPANVPFVAFSDRSIKANKFSYRASLDYRASPSLLIYGSVNRGFKSGGLNIATPGSPAFAPETLQAYEVGFKSDLLDQRVRFNMAAFYYNYANIQVPRIIQGGIQTLNGGRARSYGAEAELRAVVTRGLQLTSALSWINPEFESFPNCIAGPPNGGSPGVTSNCTGNLIPLASRVTATLALDYSRSFSSGTIALNGNVYHNSGFATEVDNNIRQSAFTQLGASIRWTTLGDRYFVGAFGRNLTNKRVITFGGTQPTGLQQVIYAAPRTYGVNIGFNF